MALKIGKRYTREEIGAVVGGGDLQSYLPHRRGKVLCGCFDPALNARAPFEIDVGDLSNVVLYAKTLVEHGNVIPVFMKQGFSAWEYVGMFRPVKYNTDPADLYPKKPRRPDAVAVLYLTRSDKAVSDDIADDSTVTATAASEGGRSLVQHLKKERSRALVEAKRRAFKKENGLLRCEACLVPENAFPPDIGEGCFEVHHNSPLSRRPSFEITRIDDLSLVCANCHRMIHRSEPMLTVMQLRSLLNK